MRSDERRDAMRRFIEDMWSRLPAGRAETVLRRSAWHPRDAFDRLEDRADLEPVRLPDPGEIGG